MAAIEMSVNVKIHIILDLEVCSSDATYKAAISALNEHKTHNITQSTESGDATYGSP